MARQPNYGQERAERQRRKAARRDERLAAKADRRDKGLPPPGPASAAAPESTFPAPAAELAVRLPEDSFALVRLGQALKFVCGAAHPTTLAILRAATSGEGSDIERAHALFLELTPRNQHAALTIATAGPSTLR